MSCPSWAKTSPGLMPAIISLPAPRKRVVIRAPEDVVIAFVAQNLIYAIGTVGRVIAAIGIDIVGVVRAVNLVIGRVRNKHCACRKAKKTKDIKHWTTTFSVVLPKSLGGHA